MKVSVKIVNKSHHALPSYSTLFSAGMDIRANLSEPVTLAPMERRLIPTGIFIALPEGYEAQIRPRSGLALKHGLSLIHIYSFPSTILIPGCATRKLKPSAARRGSSISAILAL